MEGTETSPHNLGIWWVRGDKTRKENQGPCQGRDRCFGGAASQLGALPRPRERPGGREPHAGRVCSAGALGQLGRPGRRGEDCALKACLGGGPQSQEGPGFIQMYLLWVGPCGGQVWSYQLAAPAPRLR